MAKNQDKGGSKPNAKKEGSGLSIKEKRRIKQDKQKAKV
jgi:hypothetical protein